jgi:hypothetical protein
MIVLVLLFFGCFLIILNLVIITIAMYVIYGYGKTINKTEKSINKSEKLPLIK